MCAPSIALSCSSYFASPEGDLLLFEVSSLFLVDQYQVQEVAALEAVIHVGVRGRQVGARQIKPNGYALALDGSAVHDLKLVEVLGLRHCSLS